MGPRYLAVIAPGDAAPEAVRAMVPAGEGWKLCADRPGFTLHVEADGACISPSDGHCTIIGALFGEGGSGRALDALSPEALKAIYYSRGASLLGSHWGGYVLFMTDGGAHGVEVVRDPSGAVPCYYVQNKDGIVLVTSDMALLGETGAFTPAVDWDAVAAHLIASNLRPAQTALSGVSELLGGCRLTIGSTRLGIDELWSPWTFAERDRRITSSDDAVDRLRSTTIGCVQSWASAFDHLLLGVSGGLDSSIVAACLADGGHRFSCVTFATDDPSGDERAYARILADGVEAPLHEYREAVDEIDINHSAAAHLPRPVARLFAQSGDAQQVRLAARLGVDGFISGGGGDNVFCSLSSAAPLADRILSEGFGRGVIATTADIARLAGCSSWMVLRQGLARAFLRRAGYRWPLNSAFLSDPAVERGRARVSHPWLEAPPGALPGKAAHIAWLLGVQNHLEGFGRERTHPMIAPLMSQPIVELCLRIPTWMWCGGGRNRAIARRAFAGDLPPAIIERTSKGTPASFAMQLVELHHAAFRDLLSGGLLAEQGLLDRPAIEQYLADPGLARGTSFVQVMALVDAEIWARSWLLR